MTAEVTWQDRVEASAYASLGFLYSLTKAGSITSLLTPRQVGVASVEEWNMVHGVQMPVMSRVNKPTGSTIAIITKVLNSLEVLGLRSNSLHRLLDQIKNLPMSEQAILDSSGIKLVGVTSDSLIKLDSVIITNSFVNMVKYIGSEAARKIVRMKDDEDKLLIVGFEDISLFTRVLQDVKNTSTRRNVRKVQLSNRGLARERNKMSRISGNTVTKIAQQDLGSWRSWKIDYAALARLFASERTLVASVDTMEDLIEKVSICLNLSAQAVQVVMFLECGWPEHVGRMRTGYRTTMPRDDGSLSFRGVSQAGKDFWTDVREYASDRGARVPALPEQGTLVMQIASPFIYADRYRESPRNGFKLVDWPLTAGIVYSFHQQSRGGLGSGFKTLKNVEGQSGPSLQVIKTAAAQYRKVAPSGYF